MHACMHLNLLLLHRKVLCSINLDTQINASSQPLNTCYRFGIFPLTPPFTSVLSSIMSDTDIETNINHTGFPNQFNLFLFLYINISTQLSIYLFSLQFQNKSRFSFFNVFSSHLKQFLITLLSPV